MIQQMMDSTRQNIDKILRSKGEYITHMLNLDTFSSTEGFYIEFVDCISTRKDQLKKSKLNYESVVACIIQYAYACYVSLWYQLRLQHVRIMVDQREFDMPNEPISLYVGYRPVTVSGVQLDMLTLVPSLYKKLMEAVPYFLNPNDAAIKLFWTQFEKLSKVQFAQPGKEFMLSLEETELFRRYSMLLKVKNCSILNFIQLKNKHDMLSRVRSTIKGHIEKLNELARAGKSQQTQQVKELNEEVEKCTREFFEQLGVSMRTMELSSSEDPYRLKMEIRFGEGEVNFEGNVKQLTGVQLSTGERDRSDVKFPEQEFIVEYSCERSSICVKYVTPMQLNVENSDLLMFQFNNLSFDSSNVSLELYEKIEKIGLNNLKTRYLTFKATSWFARKEPPVEKILLLMDVAMITAKIIEPEIAKPLYASRDFTKPMELHKKVSHYIAILNFVAKKVYYPKDQTNEAS